jgi:hypothetical protein
MTKRTSHSKLTVYRRHAAKVCTLTDTRILDQCECPLWVHGKVRGKFLRTSLDKGSLPTAMFKKEELLAGKPDGDPTPDGPKVVAIAPKGDTTLRSRYKNAPIRVASKTCAVIGNNPRGWGNRSTPATRQMTLKSHQIFSDENLAGEVLSHLVGPRRVILSVWRRSIRQVRQYDGLDIGKTRHLADILRGQVSTLRLLQDANPFLFTHNLPLPVCDKYLLPVIN